MKSKKYIEEVANMLRPLILKMEKSKAIAIVAAKYHWLDTDALEKGLFMAEWKVMAGAK